MLPDFRDPEFLILFLPLLFLLWLYTRRQRKGDDHALPVSSASILKSKISFKARTWKYVPFLRFVCAGFLILAMAGPGKMIERHSINTEGIDIMIALDVSPSMLAQDFKPGNRLSVAKEVVADFIKGRRSDRMGLVLFAGDSCLQCPLTLEKDFLLEILSETGFESVGEQGTAIGDALALSVSRMKEGNTATKIILLITDGENNRGIIDPETAADFCAESGIRVYTVGIGSDTPVSLGRGMPMKHFDPEILKSIASATGGTFSLATSEDMLRKSIDEINSLEKSVIAGKTLQEFVPEYGMFLNIAALIFLLEIILKNIVYRKVP